MQYMLIQQLNKKAMSDGYSSGSNDPSIASDESKDRDEEDDNLPRNLRPEDENKSQPHHQEQHQTKTEEYGVYRYSQAISTPSFFSTDISLEEFA